MSTRGLIILKDSRTENFIGRPIKPCQIAVYNHSDSYPSWLGRRLAELIQQNGKPCDVDRLKSFILSWNADRYPDEPENNWKHEVKELKKGKFRKGDINYLFDEYVYVLDLKQRLWSAYKSVWDEDGNKPVSEWNHHKGHLEPIFEDSPFDAPVEIYLLTRE